ncbi:MAG: pyridoxamine 5'-phosphate oxidase family protein [Ruminococcaceae bacterium]|nr:pyridoxamine 5'-phosphate oxidase family protein [Oscillospiraceae bacterium]
MFRDLIRKNKKLSCEECKNLLRNEKRGVLCVQGDNGYPYGMPMNHFYDEKSGKIYFHCGKVGHRLDSINRDNKVSFCVYDKGFSNEGEWALNVKSVVVFGKIQIIEETEKIISICEKLSYKFTSDKDYIDNEIKNYADKTLVLELTPEHICGKIVKES